MNVVPFTCLFFEFLTSYQAWLTRISTAAMAIPDPEMNEMRNMTYNSRRGGPRIRQTIPRRNDFIEVFWCMDHLPGLPDKWCQAKVLHIIGATGQCCNASGVILYLPDNNWDEQIHNFALLENNKLRKCDDDLDSCQNKDTSDHPGWTPPIPELSSGMGGYKKPGIWKRDFR